MSVEPEAISEWHLLEATAHALADHLDEIRTRDTELPPSFTSTSGSILTTGIGLSGGPARFFASQLSRIGYNTRFAALSEFWHQPTQTDTLVVFSQSFSGNTHLLESGQARERVIFTQAPKEKLSWFNHVVHVPHKEEHHCQVQLQSPSLSLYASMRLLANHPPSISWTSALSSVPDAVRSAFHSLPLPSNILSAPVFILSTWYDPSELHLLAWKWAETVFRGPPLAVNALEFAHGPLQVIYQQPATIICLTHPGEQDIWDRVKRVLNAKHHVCIEMSAKLPPPLSIWEFDSTFNAALLEILKAEPELLNYHPTQTIDAPVYTFGEDYHRDPAKTP